MSETALETAKRIAKECGHDADDNTLAWFIWNETGFPSFFHGDPQQEFERQLREAFATTEEE